MNPLDQTALRVQGQYELASYRHIMHGSHVRKPVTRQAFTLCRALGWKSISCRVTATGTGFMSQSRREAYEDYIRSKHWENLRRQKLSEHGRFCDACESSTHLHVHHIFYRNYTDCTTADLAVLCNPCHDDFHAASKAIGFDYIGVQVDAIKARIEQFRTGDFINRREEKRRRKAERKALELQRRGIPSKSQRRAIKQECNRMFGANCSAKSIRRLIVYLSGVISAPVPQLPPLPEPIQVAPDASLVVDVKPPKKKRPVYELPPAITEAELTAMKERQVRRKRSCACCSSQSDLKAFVLRPNTLQLVNRDFRTLCGECFAVAISEPVQTYMARYPNNSPESLYALFHFAFKRSLGIATGAPLPRKHAELATQTN